MIARIVLAVSGMTAALAVSAQDGAPTPSANPATLRTGPQIFADKCIFCHDARGWGTRSLARRTPEGQAELLERNVLPPVLVQYAVRRGVGSMPQFTPTEISDAELAILADWLDTLN